MTLRNAFADLAQDRATPSGAHLVGNARTKFRDGFASPGTQPDPSVWVTSNDSPTSHIINQGGDAVGASYLRVSLSPFVDDSEINLTSIEKFQFPTRIGWGISMSQRISGQEVFFGISQADDTDPLGIKRTVDPGAPRSIVGGGTVTSNVVTLNVTNHGFRSGDRVNLAGCPDTRFNVGPVIVTVSGYNTITVPVTIANGTYTVTGGFVRHADPLGKVDNAIGMLVENTTATQASFASRRNKSKYRLRTSTIATTANQQGNTTNWNDSFTGNTHELYCSMDEVGFRSYTSDGNGAPNGMDKYTQAFPDEELDYRLHFRAKNLKDFSRPIARITNITKSASTTVTVTTDVAHGLTTSSRVGIGGVRDQTNFPNGTDLAVASVPTATTFTAVLGPSATATDTNGGVVFLNNGGVTSPALLGFSVQSVARDSDGMVTLVLNATASGFVSGEYIHLWGINVGAVSGFEGAYKVQSTSTTSLFLEPAGGRTTGSVVTTTNTGGALIRRTDVRIHFARVLDYTRVMTEIIGGKGSSNDGNNAVPVMLTQTASINAPSIAASSTVTGTSVAKILSAATTNATSVKTSAGRIFGWHLANTTASYKYFRIYAKASAPTVGTDSPVLVIAIPPNASVDAEWTVPITVATGIAYSITGAAADLDATATAANDVVGHLIWV